MSVANVSYKNSQISPFYDRRFNQKNVAKVDVRFNRFALVPEKAFSSDVLSLSLKNNVVSFKGKNTNEKSIVAMAPLYIDLKNRDEWNKFEYNLDKVKKAGVQGISVDVWWGATEKADQNFDWRYYDKMFSTIKKHDLKIVPILSFHKCGGNVGDSVNIDLPGWSWDYLGKKLGKSNKLPQDRLKNELSYKNEQGKFSDDAIPVWYDKEILPQYKEFMKAFDKHFIKNKGYGKDFMEINVSLGASGELRFPSYGSSTLGSNAPFPNSGNFVGFSEGGQKYFKKHMQQKYKNNIGALNKSWETNYKSFYEIKITPPRELKSNYSKDFIECYNNSLAEHEKTVLGLAHKVFENSDGDFAIGFKIPGVHWNMGKDKIGRGCFDTPAPRITEIKTGLISINQDYNDEKTDYGYNKLLDVTKEIKEANKKRDTVLHFTCLEMGNRAEEWGQKVNSKAKDLVSLMLNGAKKRNITIKGENALSGTLKNPASWQNIEDAFDSNYLGDMNNKAHFNNVYDGITFLRVDDIAEDSTFSMFKNFAEKISPKKSKSDHRVYA